MVYGGAATVILLLGVDEPLWISYLMAHAAITTIVLLAPPAAKIWPVIPLRLVRDLYHLVLVLAVPAVQGVLRLAPLTGRELALALVAGVAAVVWRAPGVRHGYEERPGTPR